MVLAGDGSRPQARRYLVRTVRQNIAVEGSDDDRGLCQRHPFAVRQDIIETNSIDRSFSFQQESLLHPYG